MEQQNQSVNINNGKLFSKKSKPLSNKKWFIYICIALVMGSVLSFLWAKLGVCMLCVFEGTASCFDTFVKTGYIPCIPWLPWQ